VSSSPSKVDAGGNCPKNHAATPGTPPGALSSCPGTSLSHSPLGCTSPPLLGGLPLPQSGLPYLLLGGGGISLLSLSLSRRSRSLSLGGGDNSLALFGGGGPMSCDIEWPIPDRPRSGDAARFCPDVDPDEPVLVAARPLSCRSEPLLEPELPVPPGIQPRSLMAIASTLEYACRCAKRRIGGSSYEQMRLLL
jgi:hypothetical protein